MDRIRERIAQHLGVPNVTRRWQARVRTQPLPARGGRWLWTTIQSQPLYGRKDGKTSITLMWVEGFVQATQDLATITALELTNDATLIPDWPVPPRTGVSANPPPPPYALTP
ncbi:hypothetical protein AB0D32_24005 [Micromonospora sp. NPDC048170]|uniref:hypothetical protein n=1 Tax=Micromonospora sp. NPDC048170 TaxID=3154819 RepID=UPI0033C3829D